MYVSEGCDDCASSDKFYETPLHTVTVSDFHIGKYEVTQAQWRAVMGDSITQNVFAVIGSRLGAYSLSSGLASFSSMVGKPVMARRISLPTGGHPLT